MIPGLSIFKPDISGYKKASGLKLLYETNSFLITLYDNNVANGMARCHDRNLQVA